jgi:hypothetical protein
MHDFWLSCGHHLIDRDAGGGLLVTDEFLKVYLARPELLPASDACATERKLMRPCSLPPAAASPAERFRRSAMMMPERIGS